MARKKRVPTVRMTVKLTLADHQALRSVAATIDRDENWVLGKLCRLAVGKLELSTEMRRWLRGDTAWDAGLPDDQQALLTIGNPDPEVVTVERRKTVAQDPPSLEEVRAYINEMGYGFSAEEFVDHYVANGWKQASGLPLLDWKRACRSPFQRNWLERNPQAKAASDWGKDRPAEADATVVDNQTASLPLEDEGGHSYMPDTIPNEEEPGYLEDNEA